MYCQLLLAAAAALMFVIVPLEGAFIPTVHSPTVITELPDSAENTTRNATTSGKDNVFMKFLTTLQSYQESSSTLDSSTHSRVRRFTEVSIETVYSSSEDLPTRSKCMWTYSYNTDPNRLPRTLLEAHCSQLHLPGVAGQCEHVYYYVPVRRNESGTWTDHWMSMRVGCTLAVPLVAPPITFD